MGFSYTVRVYSQYISGRSGFKHGAAGICVAADVVVKIYSYTSRFFLIFFL